MMLRCLCSQNVRPMLHRCRCRPTLVKALKSGQLPADLKISDDDTITDGGDPKDDNEMEMDTQNEANPEQDTEDQQANNNPTPVEQDKKGVSGG